MNIEPIKGIPPLMRVTQALETTIGHFKELSKEMKGLRPSEIFVLSEVKEALKALKEVANENN